jgi:hypothetical protein
MTRVTHLTGEPIIKADRDVRMKVKAAGDMCLNELLGR